MPKTTGEVVLIDRFEYGSAIKVQPVNEESLKNHLQVTHDLDDDIIYEIGGYLPAAVNETENRGTVSLIRQRRRLYLGTDVLPYLTGENIALPFGPILAVTSVKYLDADGAEQTMAGTYYRATVDTCSIYFKDCPVLADGPNTVWIDYESGYGNDPSAVPALWQNIVAQIAFRKYDLRGGDGGANAEKWERMIQGLVNIAGASQRYV